VLGRDRCGIAVDLCGENKRRPAWTAPVSVKKRRKKRRGGDPKNPGTDRQDTGGKGTDHSHTVIVTTRSVCSVSGRMQNTKCQIL
jgi:hypothetical protein